MSEIFKAVLFGIVEGITEWLPVSSTGHMIILDELISLKVSGQFMSMFLVVIQLGAILAVVSLYWKRLVPFSVAKHTTKRSGKSFLAGAGRITVRQDVWSMWFKIFVACVPAAVVGIVFDEKIEEYFYHYQTVAAALIIFGILFLVTEEYNKNRKEKISQISQITCKDALIIGIFQLIAAVFPGTSRSGATILGGILLGCTRTAAAEFTFFLAVPVMAGASLLKLVKFGQVFTGYEMTILLTGMCVSYAVSVIVIRGLMDYIRRHDFKVFGWYRIVLGIVVILFFSFR